MCIIINKLPGIKLEDELYHKCIINHSDGIGIAYVDGGQLIVDKGLWKIDHFLKRIEGLDDKHVLIHFRNASKDMPVNDSQCHPFVTKCSNNWLVEVEENGKTTEVPRYEFAISHNGKLDYKSTNIRSDTNCFVDEILGPILAQNPYFLDLEENRFLLGRAICPQPNFHPNKMAIMRYDLLEDKHDVYIINPKLGVEDLGCWFSNDSYKPLARASIVTYQWPNPKNLLEDTPSTPDTGFFLKDLMNVDKFGWVWSFQVHKWRNLRTGQTADRLSKRFWRPYYMRFKPFDGADLVMLQGDVGEMSTKELEKWKKDPAKVEVNHVLLYIPLDLETPEHAKISWDVPLPPEKPIIIPALPQTPTNGGTAGEVSHPTLAPETTSFLGGSEDTNSGKTLVLDLGHLSKDERGKLKRAAMLYCKAPMSGYAGVKGLTFSEAINLLREDMKQASKEIYDKGDMQVDLWILTQIGDMKDPTERLVDIVCNAQAREMDAELNGTNKMDAGGGPTEYDAESLWRGHHMNS